MRLVQIAASFLATFLTIDVYLNDGVVTRTAWSEGLRAAQHLNEKIEYLVHPMFPRT